MNNPGLLHPWAAAEPHGWWQKTSCLVQTKSQPITPAVGVGLDDLWGSLPTELFYEQELVGRWQQQVRFSSHCSDNRATPLQRLLPKWHRGLIPRSPQISLGNATIGRFQPNRRFPSPAPWTSLRRKINHLQALLCSKCCAPTTTPLSQAFSVLPKEHTTPHFCTKGNKYREKVLLLYWLDKELISLKYFALILLNTCDYILIYDINPLCSLIDGGIHCSPIGNSPTKKLQFVFWEN